MLPFSFDYDHLAIESFIFRTMHSSALHALECIAWGRSETSDCETSDDKTGDVETGNEGASESKIFERSRDRLFTQN